MDAWKEIINPKTNNYGLKECITDEFPNNKQLALRYSLQIMKDLLTQIITANRRAYKVRKNTTIILWKELVS